MNGLVSSDDEEYENSEWKGKPATIVLINTFDNGSFNTALTAHAVTCRMMRQYLRASSDRLLGVCLYGIEKSNSSLLETKSAVDIVPLTAQSLENFKTLKNFNVGNIIPSKELIMSDVLWHCQTLFTNLKVKVSSCDIIILSRFDVPPCKTDEERTLNRVSKLVDDNINIKLINISKTNYEVHSFYKDFMVEATRQKDVTLPESLWDVKVLESLIVQHSNRHLMDAQLKFHIGNETTIAVGVYNILKSYESTRLKIHKVDKDTNAIVKSYNQTVKTTVNHGQESDMDVEEEVQMLKSELLHSKVFADKKISFTDNEMKLIQNPFGPPMIKLLGFKPVNYMAMEKWFFRSGYFLYPNESKMEGSTVVFKALHKSCIDMRVVAICMLCKSFNSKPQLVALLPFSQPFNLNIEVGFDVISIPFKENVKDIPIQEEETEVINNEKHKHFLNNILSKLEFNYQPEMFENPVLQCQYRALEVKKLGDDIDPFIDTTKSKSEFFEGLEDDLFFEYFGPFGPITAKRATASLTTTVNSKKSKLEGYDENYVQNMIKQKTVDKFTKSDLIQILKHHNVEKVSNILKKPELVNMVYKHCSTL